MIQHLISHSKILISIVTCTPAQSVSWREKSGRAVDIMSGRARRLIKKEKSESGFSRGDLEERTTAGCSTDWCHVGKVTRARVIGWGLTFSLVGTHMPRSHIVLIYGKTRALDIFIFTHTRAHLPWCMGRVSVIDTVAHWLTIASSRLSHGLGRPDIFSYSPHRYFYRSCPRLSRVNIYYFTCNRAFKSPLIWYAFLSLCWCVRLFHHQHESMPLFDSEEAFFFCAHRSIRDQHHIANWSGKVFFS